MTDAEKYVAEHGDKVMEFVNRVACFETSGNPDPGINSNRFGDVMPKGCYEIRSCPHCRTLHIGDKRPPWYCYGDCYNRYEHARPRTIPGEWLEIPIGLIMPFYRMIL